MKQIKLTVISVITIYIMIIVTIRITIDYIFESLIKMYGYKLNRYFIKLYRG